MRRIDKSPGCGYKKSMTKAKSKTAGRRKPAVKRATKLKPVIVRTYSAGVHFGYLALRNGREVTLHNARRCWRWYVDHGRHGNRQNTCSELAAFGPYGDSRIGVAVAEHVLLDAIEVLICSSEAAAALEGWRA